MPAFKKGDTIKDNQGTYAEIDGVTTDGCVYGLTIITPGASAQLTHGQKVSMSSADIDDACTLVRAAPVYTLPPMNNAQFHSHIARLNRELAKEAAIPAPVRQLKPCTCDSLELFRKGCQCGAVAKRKWGLGA